MVLAMIPIMFAVQQAIEGLQWIVDKPSLESTLLGYGFLFFAFIVWPVYIPYAAYVNEKKGARKRLLKWFVVLGGAVAVFLVGVMVSQELAIDASECCRLVYDFDLPSALGAGVWVYGLATMGACFISSSKAIRWFGIVSFIAFLVSLYIYTETFVSTWCFFAAAICIFIHLYIVRASKRPARKKRR